MSRLTPVAWTPEMDAILVANWAPDVRRAGDIALVINRAQDRFVGASQVSHRAAALGLAAGKKLRVNRSGLISMRNVILGGANAHPKRGKL